MSRSYKKPICKICGCSSEKIWKRFWHQRYRHNLDQAIACGEDENFQSHRKMSDPWSSPSDGKINYDPQRWIKHFPDYLDSIRLRFFKKGKVWKIRK